MKYCPACGQEIVAAAQVSPTLEAAIRDYHEIKAGLPSADAIRARLAPVVEYLDTLGNVELRCSSVDERWIAKFRDWLQAKPIVTPSGKHKTRALSTTENSVLQLAAVVNYADPRGARFKPQQPKEVNRTPQYRADVKTLAKMFTYALEPKKKRGSLLAFLRMSVLTLGRPDAVLEASVDPERGQWDRAHALFNLNPKGRRQTLKRRALVPIAKQGVPWLNSLEGAVVKATTVKTAWNAMVEELGLPKDGESGSKLIRRSMADLLRRRMGVDAWTEIALFLGHNSFDSVSELYAPLHPEYLLRAKGAIERIIDEVESLAPGAFYRTFTADDEADRAGKVA